MTPEQREFLEKLEQDMLAEAKKESVALDWPKMQTSRGRGSRYWIKMNIRGSLGLARLARQMLKAEEREQDPLPPEGEPGDNHPYVIRAKQRAREILRQQGIEVDDDEDPELAAGEHRARMALEEARKHPLGRVIEGTVSTGGPRAVLDRDDD